MPNNQLAFIILMPVVRGLLPATRQLQTNQTPSRSWFPWIRHSQVGFGNTCLYLVPQATHLAVDPFNRIALILFLSIATYVPPLLIPPCSHTVR